MTNERTLNAADRPRSRPFRNQRSAAVIRWAAAIVFVGFGAAKFGHHGAIVVSGLAHGEHISLTLAPALLLAMIFLIAVGDGSRSLDRALHRDAVVEMPSLLDQEPEEGV